MISMSWLIQQEFTPKDYLLAMLRKTQVGLSVDYTMSEHFNLVANGYL